MRKSDSLLRSSLLFSRSCVTTEADSSHLSCFLTNSLLIPFSLCPHMPPLPPPSLCFLSYSLRGTPCPPRPGRALDSSPPQQESSDFRCCAVRQKHLPRSQQGAAKSTPVCVFACKWAHLSQTSPESWEYLSIHTSSPYLELAGVVIVCGALSSLLQRDEGETSEISRASCHEDHCKTERHWSVKRLIARRRVTTDNTGERDKKAAFL